MRGLENEEFEKVMPDKKKKHEIRPWDMVFPTLNKRHYEVQSYKEI